MPHRLLPARAVRSIDAPELPVVGPLADEAQRARRCVELADLDLAPVERHVRSGPKAPDRPLCSAARRPAR